MGKSERVQHIGLGSGWWREKRPGTTAKAIEMAEPVEVFDPKKLYLPQEVADTLGLSVVTVRGWARCGKLKTLPLPKGFRILGKAANEFLTKERIKKRH